MKSENYFTRLFFVFALNCLLLTVISHGQASIQWQWLYPGPYDGDDLGYDICTSTDGNFFLVGGATGFNYFPNFYVKKIDPDGNIIWSRAIGGTSGTGYAYAVAPTLGGGCVATGDAARFLKFNANGDTIVNKVLIGDRRLLDIKRTADNNYIACGRYDVDNSIIIKFDSLGNRLWENIYLTPYIKHLFSIEEGIDGGYVAVGRNQNFFGDTIRLLIIKVSENGDSLWEKEYPGSSGFTINKLSNNYIISGGRLVVKTDKLGNRYTSYFLDSLGSTEQITDMKLFSPNRFVFSTNIAVPGDVRSKILLSDSSGNVIRIKNFNFSNYVVLKKLEVCSNFDIIFMGHAGLYDTSSKSLMYAFRTDSLFNVPAIGIIGIAQLGNSIPNNFKLYQNYPNPFNNSTIIEFDIVENDYYEMKIYNVLGQKIRTILQDYKTAGKYRLSLEMNNLASGVYIYTISNSKKMLTNKLTFIK